jgi:hypothetical protein
VDPYVTFEVRKGRRQRSRTIDNNDNPVYNDQGEDRFSLIVDDFSAQKLHIKVRAQGAGRACTFSSCYVCVGGNGGRQLCVQCGKCCTVRGAASLQLVDPQPPAQPPSWPSRQT